MFIRKKKNKSGSVSIQIIQKEQGKYKVYKTIGCAHSAQEETYLMALAQQNLSQIQGKIPLFASDQDMVIESFLDTLENAEITVVGPELIFGKIYEHIGFGALGEELFKHLVISRIVWPGSKLKMIDYLYRYQRTVLGKDQVYRFLDKLSSGLRDQVSQISYQHTLGLSPAGIMVAFYDMTTLYFETSDEDDLRQTGFSKDGKPQKPQIFIGLLISAQGFPIAYDIYQGSIYEGKTLIPFLQKIEKRFKLSKPIIVADSGLLSKQNTQSLHEQGYSYILGARIKNLNAGLKNELLGHSWQNGTVRRFQMDSIQNLVVTYSEKRAKKDAHNRQRGIERLEKKFATGKLSKSSLNNRGYNKFLRMKGELELEIDYSIIEKDRRWDGLKGYLSNTQKLSKEEIVEQYQQLWKIEKAFRMSKTDLQIRPVYHRLQNRIEAHICIAFVAYSILMEAERLMKAHKIPFSVQRATEICKNMYQIQYTLPEAKEVKTKLLKMDAEQQILFDLILKNY